MAYQDRWIRGQVEARGERACEPRYDLVRAVVAEYTRPITVLDLGANQGYFGCRLADEFGAVSVMIEGRADLVEVCRANALPTTIALRRKLSVADLWELAYSEHFDVVLALNVLHHFQDSLSAFDAVRGMGDQVIIETPSLDDKGACGKRSHLPLLEAIESFNPDVLGYEHSHVTPGVKRPIFRLEREGQKTAVTQGYAFRARLNGNHAVRDHVIESTLDRKTVTYASGEERDWYPGMNLWNWCQLGGAYPDREAVVRAVTDASDEHGDLRPWNFVLQGDRVVPIDTTHRTTHAGEQALDETIAWIREPERAYIRA